MYKAKLCLGLSGQFGIPGTEQIALLRKIGFEGFFAEWEPGTDISQLRSAADAEGMIFQSIHAPYTKMADMWKHSDMTETAVKELLDCVHACAINDVPIMVIHSFIGFEDHSPTDLGIANYARVVDEAERCGIMIAIENTEGEEYLAALMDAFRGRKNVGFCWDTGHELCYNHSKDMMALYGDRILCTHLNDNLGIRDFDGSITYIDDLHLLPFDGIANWYSIAARLHMHGFRDILTFELNTVSKPGRHENDAYGRMDIAEYLTQAYMRACRVASLVSTLENQNSW